MVREEDVAHPTFLRIPSYMRLGVYSGKSIDTRIRDFASLAFRFCKPLILLTAVTVSR